jgi:hypothetical protein
MPDAPFSAEEAERRLRQLLEDNGLRAPDEVQPRADGGITCLWYREKLAVVVTEEELSDGNGD